MKSLDTSLALKCLLFTYASRFITHPNWPQPSCRIIHPHLTWQMGTRGGRLGNRFCSKTPVNACLGCSSFPHNYHNIWLNIPCLYFCFSYIFFIFQAVVSIDHSMHAWVARHFTFDYILSHLNQNRALSFFVKRFIWILLTIWFCNIWGPSFYFSQCDQMIVKTVCGKIWLNN